jgi:hypothetical protein
MNRLYCVRDTTSRRSPKRFKGGRRIAEDERPSRCFEGLDGPEEDVGNAAEIVLFSTTVRSSESEVLRSASFILKVVVPGRL